MEGEHRDRLEPGREEPLLQHQRSASLLADRRPFLSGLEDEDHGAGEPRLHLGEGSGDAQGDRDVHVVPADVGHADVLAVVVDAHRRGEGEVGLLHHRERVHIGPDRDDGPGATAAEDPHDPGARDAGVDLEPEGGEAGGHQRGSAGLVVAELGMRMDVVADGDQLGEDPVEAGAVAGVVRLGEEAQGRSGAGQDGEHDAGAEIHEEALV